MKKCQVGFGHQSTRDTPSMAASPISTATTVHKQITIDASTTAQPKNVPIIVVTQASNPMVVATTITENNILTSWLTIQYPVPNHVMPI